MNWKRIKLLMIKDLKFIVGNKRIFFPLMVTPLMLLVFTPITTIYGLKTGNINGGFIPDKIINNLPKDILNITADFSNTELYIFLFANYLMSILFIMLPLLICSSVSAASMIQEKENKTMETLLYSPITKLDLFIGKILGAFIPSLIVSYIGLGLYLLVVYIFTNDMFNQFILQDFWIPLSLFLIPVSLLFTIIGNILASSKAKNMQEAQQFSVVLTFPFMLLIMGQFLGDMFITNKVVVNLSITFVVINVLLVFFMVKRSSNEKILKL